MKLRFRSLFFSMNYQPQVQVDCATEYHGSDYGGWTICPTHLNTDSIVYSLGVGEDITFDLSLIAQYGVQVYAFDPTPKSVNWVRAQVLPDQFRFIPMGMLDHDGTVTFYPPENPDFVSHTISPEQYPTSDRAINLPIRRLVSVMTKLGHSQIEVLKMDIEGSEYRVIDDMLRCGIEVGQLLVEFHHRFKGIGVRKTKRAIKALNRRGYRIFAVSKSGEEVSFIRLRP
jgi:FkbM family methyltransferase